MTSIFATPASATSMPSLTSLTTFQVPWSLARSVLAAAGSSFFAGSGFFCGFFWSAATTNRRATTSRMRQRMVCLRGLAACPRPSSGVPFPVPVRKTRAQISSRGTPCRTRCMRDYLLFYLNGRRCRVGGETAFLSLADYLRQDRRLTGTKVVCAEGDCGACTVLLGRLDGDRLRYETANGCIQFLYQLDGKHVVTVEGLRLNGELHPIQEAMVACHGSQCGY